MFFCRINTQIFHKQRAKILKKNISLKVKSRLNMLYLNKVWTRVSSV